MGFKVLVGLAILAVCHGAPQKLQIPSYITRCSRTDPKLAECTRTAFRAVLPHLKDGIPELRIPSIEPFKVDKIAMDLGTFRAQFENVKVHNATNVKLIQNEIDYPKLIGKMVLRFPEINIIGNYEVGGKLLLLELNGKGTGSVSISNITAYVNWVGERYAKKGKNYIRMGDGTNLDVKVDHVQFIFGELFKGNPQLEQITNQILNDNIEEFTKEIKPVAMNIVKGLTFSIVNAVFNTFTEDELFLP